MCSCGRQRTTPNAASYPAAACRGWRHKNSLEVSQRGVTVSHDLPYEDPVVVGERVRPTASGSDENCDRAPAVREVHIAQQHKPTPLRLEQVADSMSIPTWHLFFSAKLTEAGGDVMCCGSFIVGEPRQARIDGEWATLQLVRAGQNR